MGLCSVISFALDMLDTDLNNQKQKVVGIKFYPRLQSKETRHYWSA